MNRHLPPPRLALLLAILFPMLAACEPWHTSSGAATAAATARGEWSIGRHSVRLDADQAATNAATVSITPVRLSLRRIDLPTPLFDTLPNESPLLAALVDVEQSPGKLKTKIREWCREANFTAVNVRPHTLTLSGELTCPSGTQAFVLEFSEIAEPASKEPSVSLTVTLGEGPANQITLRAASSSEEGIDDVRDSAKAQPLKGEKRSFPDGDLPVLRTTTGRHIAIETPAPLVVNAADARLLQFDHVGRELALRLQALTP